MSDLDSRDALIRIRTAALTHKTASPLVKRGLADLQFLKGADWWFQRALNLSRELSFEESHQCLLKTVELHSCHVNALLRLGWDFKDGLETEPNLGEAVKYFRRAAELGSTEGKHQIAYLFMNGSGEPEEPPNSEAYFRKYAEMGNPCA